MKQINNYLEHLDNQWEMLLRIKIQWQEEHSIGIRMGLIENKLTVSVRMGLMEI
jgi:hypothetical protein